MIGFHIPIFYLGDHKSRTEKEFSDSAARAAGGHHEISTVYSSPVLIVGSERSFPIPRTNEQSIEVQNFLTRGMEIP
jgi:hypothetical protein